MNSVNVYVGDYGTYLIPEDVYAKALDINKGKKVNDRRTKGARYLKWWGKCQDATESTKIAIVQHYKLN
jgi:hypothetical protein